MKSLIAICAVCALAATCVSGRDAEFKPLRYKPGRTAEAKAYKPGKTLDNRVYEEKKFAPREARLVRTPKVYSEKPFEDRADEDLALPVYVKEEKVARENDYKPGNPQRVITLKPDPRTIPEKKPFDDKGKRIDGKAFVPNKREPVENPILKPRQGIKELHHDDE